MASLKSSQRKFIRSLSTGGSKRGEGSASHTKKTAESSTPPLHSERSQQPGEQLLPSRPGMSKSPDFQGSRDGRRDGRGRGDILSSTMHPRIAPSLRESPSNDALFRTMAPANSLRSGGYRGQGKISDRLHSTVGSDGMRDFRGYLAEAQKFQARLQKEKSRADKDVERLLLKSPSDPHDGNVTGSVDEGKSGDISAEKNFEWYARLFLETPCDQLDEELKSFIESGLYNLGKAGDKRARTCLFYMNKLLQMLGCLHHSDTLDTMSRTKTQIKFDSTNKSLADDELMLLKFKQSIKRRSDVGKSLRFASHTEGAKKRRNRIRNSIVSFSTEKKLLLRNFTPEIFDRTPNKAGSGPASLYRTHSTPTSTSAHVSGHRPTQPRHVALDSVDELEGDFANGQAVRGSASGTALQHPMVVSPPDCSSSESNRRSKSATHPAPLMLDRLNSSEDDFTSYASVGAKESHREASSLGNSPASSSPSKTPSSNSLAGGVTEQDKSSSKTSESRASQEYFSPAPDSSEKSIDDFEILEPLSRGAYGRIFLARDLDSHEYVAIKVMRKSELVRKNRVDFIIAEQQIMANVAEQALPFVVTLKCSFQSKRYLFLCMEYCPGGDMLSLLQGIGALDEDVARHYLAEITLALGALHALGIVHRDIKPDNICIDRRGHVKLTDFGLSFAGVDDGEEGTMKDPLNDSDTACADEARDEGKEGTRENRTYETSSGIDFGKIGPGTPDYMAPEILLGREHTAAVDWWSLGVVAYELVCGAPPFNAPTKEEVFNNIIEGSIYWPTAEEIGEEISDNLVSFIQDLLTFDPQQRLGTFGDVDAVKKHPFFSKGPSEICWEKLTFQHDNVPFVPEVESELDISYFSPDRRKDMHQVQEPETPLHKRVNHKGRFENFTFTAQDTSARHSKADLAKDAKK